MWHRTVWQVPIFLTDMLHPASFSTLIVGGGAKFLENFCYLNWNYKPYIRNSNLIRIVIDSHKLCSWEIWQTCNWEDLYLLEINAFIQLKINKTFRRNMSPPSCFHPDFLFGLFFDFEDGVDMFLRNVCCFQGRPHRYIPKDRTLHNHLCKNHKSYI
jgi:hypothetical protein